MKNSQKSGKVFEQKDHMWQAHSKHHTQQWQDVKISSQIRKQDKNAQSITVILHGTESPSHRVMKET